MSSFCRAIVLSALLTGFSPVVFADDDDKKDQDEVKAIADYEALKKYQATGKVRNCISLNRIDQTKVLDDKTIFFEMRGKKHYINRMKHKCPSLKREERFMYKTSIGRLCNVDIITVLDSFGRSWASCGLGKFEEIELKPKVEPDSEPDSETVDETK